MTVTKQTHMSALKTNDEPAIVDGKPVIQVLVDFGPCRNGMRPSIQRPELSNLVHGLVLSAAKVWQLYVPFHLSESRSVDEDRYCFQRPEQLLTRTQKK